MKKLALSVELLGIAAIATGIIIEFTYEAGLGFMTITTGSLLIAIGALIWAKIIPPTKIIT